MDFIDLFKSILESPLDKAYPPGFLTRVRYISNLDQFDDERPHSIASPMHLTDLGVREFDDPKILLSECLDVEKLEYLNDPDFIRPLKIGKIQKLASYLDAYIYYLPVITKMLRWS